MSRRFEVEDVLQQLTEAQKIALIAGADYWHTTGLPQFGIPKIRTSDGPNGIRGQNHFNSTPTACIPSGTALASTWDDDLLFQVGVLLDKEARAKGVHVILGPTANIQRVPLGGRGFESFSEDPYLSGILSAAYIKGFQKSGLAATMKHFVGNDQEHERFSSNSVISQRALREIYLRPFEIAIKESQPKAIMTSYNRVNGVHVSEDKYLLSEVLRHEWGYQGLIMSDWTGTYSTTEALLAGLDLEMPGPGIWRGANLSRALVAGKISDDVLDERARKVLQLANSVIDAGIEDNKAEEQRDTPETRAFLRKIAGEAVVLLKNKDGVLPLKKEKTLVIGPNAIYTAYSGGGSALVTPYYTVSPFDAISKEIGPENVSFQIGAYSHRYMPSLARYLKLDNGSTGVRFQIYNEPFEVKDRVAVDDLTLRDINYFRMNDYVNPKLKSNTFYCCLTSNFIPESDGTFDFGLSAYGTALLFLDDQLIIDNLHNQKPGESFYGKGTVEVRGSYIVKAGTPYRLRIEFGSSPTSMLHQSNPVFFGAGGLMFGGAPRINDEQEIQQAAEAARQASQVILVTGLNKEWESEGSDRKNMKLPGHNDRLIDSVLDANPCTVVVIQAGTPVEMPWESKAKALLYTSYGGNETGSGIADVIFGNVNPAGKLPLTFPKRLEDCPGYLNFGTENGRVLYGEDVYVGYRFYDTLGVSTLFPFGHGLSYTSFALSDLKVHYDDMLEVEVLAKNTGDRAGAEVVQVYIHHNCPAIKRPFKELKGFSKVFLEAGSSQKLCISINGKFATSYWNEARGKWIMEAGNYTVLVGTSSEGEFLEQEFTVSRPLEWLDRLV
ncbi:uncharacterized protein OGAPODRAFT_12856 [Ogataea polymorpha]|uniref:uncharacterized protein n=1 Tax=Ogataea polymorpha TaxID=460523 RepID=UPI0007F41D37|nr:uncharacterized protein OGAPODRAFT_12856 [Ogataea polymorpha]OBA16913.1 hypothetical protein OGAPODRAFT_12856 [Ogataea polymorpha]